MEPNPSLSPRREKTQEDRDIELIQNLEYGLGRSSSSSTDRRDFWHYILFRIYGHGKISKQMLNKGLDFYRKKWGDISVNDLLDKFKRGLHKEKLKEEFDNWLKLIEEQKILKEKLEAIPSVVAQEREINNLPKEESGGSASTEELIKLAQGENYKIENLLDKLIAQINNKEFIVEKKRDKYNLPEYEILSKKKKILGIIRFSTKETKNGEINVLEFIKFDPNYNDPKTKTKASVKSLATFNVKSIDQNGKTLNNFIKAGLIGIGAIQKEEIISGKEEKAAATSA